MTLVESIATARPIIDLYPIPKLERGKWIIVGYSMSITYHKKIDGGWQGAAVEFI